MPEKTIPKESQEYLKPLINPHSFHSVQTKLLRFKYLLELFRNIEIICKNSEEEQHSLGRVTLYFQKSTIIFLNLPKSIPCFLSKNIHPHKSPVI